MTATRRCSARAMAVVNYVARTVPAAALTLLVSLAAAGAAEWKLYDMTQLGLDNMYYDKASVTVSGSVVRVATRVVHSPRTVKDYAQQDPKYQDLKQTESIMEINCKARMWRGLQGVNVDTGGSVIDRTERETEWEAIIPESTMEALSKEVCPGAPGEGKDRQVL